MSSESDPVLSPEAVNNRVTALATKIDNLVDELNEEREQRRELEERLEEKDERIHQLEERIARLESRTDLLDLVEHADQTDGRQRSIALIQHLKRKAESNERSGRAPVASVNRDRAEEALHHPNVHRTTIHSDMRRAERIVGDEGVLTYDGDDEARLKLNLENGDLPSAAIAEDQVVEEVDR